MDDILFSPEDDFSDAKRAAGAYRFGDGYDYGYGFGDGCVPGFGYHCGNGYGKGYGHNYGYGFGQSHGHDDGNGSGRGIDFAFEGYDDDEEDIFDDE